MPLPKTNKVGTIVKFLKREKPGMKKDQRIAIAISQARKSGADIPKQSKALKKDAD